ncbi:U3 small nucleolar RNA-associated protein 6-domain-containing protein, partial [Dimargaris cristalligena]
MSFTATRHLESQAPEFRAYQRFDIFSADEVKAVVKKRAYFENLLQSGITSKLDFLRYIEYELRLGELRWSRFERVYGEIDESPKSHHSRAQANQKKEVRRFLEQTQGRRIRSLFRRILSRYPTDVTLWLQYIAIIESFGDAHELPALFSEAIVKNPCSSQLWIQAGAWQYANIDDPMGARRIFLRAIRINPEAKNIWQEYFKLELLYVERFTQRETLREIIEKE